MGSPWDPGELFTHALNISSPFPLHAIHTALLAHSRVIKINKLTHVAQQKVLQNRMQLEKQEAVAESQQFLTLPEKCAVAQISHLNQFMSIVTLTALPSSYLFNGLMGITVCSMMTQHPSKCYSQNNLTSAFSITLSLSLFLSVLENIKQ